MAVASGRSNKQVGIMALGCHSRKYAKAMRPEVAWCKK